MEWFCSRMLRARISNNGINSARQAEFTTLLGRPKYRSIGVLANTQLCLDDDVDDLKEMRCSQNEWFGMV